MHLYKREYCKRLLKKYIQAYKVDRSVCDCCHEVKRTVCSFENCVHRACFDCQQNFPPRCPVCGIQKGNVISNANMEIILNNLIILSSNESICKKKTYFFLSDVVVVTSSEK
ncbi:hypothetical protein WA588_000807 [Blastocystis sp. NMH]